MKRISIFFLILLIAAEENLYAQLRVAELDSLNQVLLQKKDVSLSKLGKSQIKMKDGSVYKNCTIVLVTRNYITYEKGKTLHDHLIDKLAVIKFHQYPLELVFTNNGMGQIKQLTN